MSINVTNAEVERLVRRLKHRGISARRTSCSTSCAVSPVDLDLDLEEAMERARGEDRRLRERFNARPVIDPRPRETQAELASEAFDRFGKGRHPAWLNYGDCFAYALAKASRAPLLFKGADVSQTDIEAALQLS